jgi:hypothetical protein
MNDWLSAVAYVPDKLRIGQRHKEEILKNDTAQTEMCFAFRPPYLCTANGTLSALK